MNRFELNSAALRISAELAQEGLPGWATRVLDATSLSATGAEICMALRSALLQFLTAGSSCRPHTLQLVRSFLNQIDPVMV